jgi:hypothetical protein
MVTSIGFRAVLFIGFISLLALSAHRAFSRRIGPSADLKLDTLLYRVAF